MGDLILAQLALEFLNIDYRKLDWIIEQRSAPWADYTHLNYVCYDGPLRLIAHKAACYETVINTEQYFGLSQAIASLCLAPQGKAFAFSTNRAARFADVISTYDWMDSYEGDEFARIFSLATNGRPPALMEPRCRRFPVSGPRLVGVAGLQIEARSLSLQKICELITSWNQGRSFTIVAAAQDKEFARTLAKQFGNASIFEGTFSETCDLISRSEELFCVDGGLVHIASYFGVPVTAIFTSGREQKWKPFSNGSSIIANTTLACRPCTKFGQVPKCSNGFACKQLDYCKDRRILFKQETEL